MDSRQKKILIRIPAIALLAWLIFAFASCNRERDVPLSQAPLIFDASNAYRLTREFVAENPIRVLGSLEARQSTSFLQSRLQELGYQLSYSDFNARIGRREVGRNILGYRQGLKNETVALIANYDTARTTVQGAMKNGAGVGALLELARILASKPVQRSVLLVLSDGKEWGMLGIRDLMANYAERNSIVAALSLDYVSVGDLAAFRIDTTGEMKGFTPAWLRQIAVRAAEASGLPARSPRGAREHMERALLISLADQGPFLGAGIPAVNLGSESANPELEKAVYHSPQDTIENLKVASIEKFGKTAERILYTLDETPEIPRESSGFFRLWDSFYLSPAAIRLLHAIVFLPLAAALFFHLKNHREDFSRIGIVREVLAFLETAFPFLLAYSLIGLCRLLRLFPAYTLYPATATKDPLLDNPDWRVLGGVLGAALFTGLLCYAIGKFSFRSYPKPNFYASKTTLLALAAVLAGLSYSYNSYWATLFLAMPSWIWAAAGRGADFKSKTAHMAWMLAGGAPLYFFLWTLGAGMGWKWNLIWHSMLALNYGMFTAAGYFLGVGAIALGIRFLAIQSHGNERPLQDRSGASIVLNLKKEDL